MPPPTRANSATEEAPTPKPWMCETCSVPPYSRYRRPRPSRPRAATHRPITAPPLKATRSELGRPPSRAATAVRTLALVAASMPSQPASEEVMAPTQKDTKVCWPRPGMNSRMAETTAAKASR